MGVFHTPVSSFCTLLRPSSDLHLLTLQLDRYRHGVGLDLVVLGHQLYHYVLRRAHRRPLHH